MKNVEDVSIPVRVTVTAIFAREHHDVSSCMRINSILLPPIVVRCIVHPDNAMAVHVIVDDDHVCSFFICKHPFIAVIFKVKESSKQVI